MSDRDLLIEAITKLDGLTESFAETRRSVAVKADSARVDKLEDDIATKAEAEHLGKVEERVDGLQRKVYWLLGLVGAVSIVISKLKF